VVPHARHARPCANDLGAIAVAGDDGTLPGVVEREQLMSKLILSLTGSGERE
jgi:hypothetical protein